MSTGLSDFHKMIVTVLKTTFPKVKPKNFLYRDYSKFIASKFRSDLRDELYNQKVKNYGLLEEVFVSVLNKHAPCKKKLIRANHKPYMTKALRNVIMRRSHLENKFYKNRTVENNRQFKRQKTIVIDFINAKDENIIPI